MTAAHSTAKSIIAVAVKDNEGPWYIHIGPAVLADKATLFLDEIAAMKNWEDQNEFLQLMNTNRCPFNKADIDQMLYAETNFTLAANPTSLNWRNPTEITKDELNVKLTVLDRLDMILIFKDIIANKSDIEGIEHDRQYKQKVKEWSHQMVDVLKASVWLAIWNSAIPRRFQRSTSSIPQPITTTLNSRRAWTAIPRRV